MEIAKRHSGKLLLFALLSLADLILTLHLLQRPGSQVYESNPIANAWITSFGLAGLACYKILMVMTVASLCVIISRYRPCVAGRILQLGCAATGMVVLYSCVLSGFFNERGLPMRLAAVFIR